MASRIQKRKREPSTASASKIRRSSLGSSSNPIVETEWRPAREDMFAKPLDERTLRSAASIRSPIATRRRTTMFGSTTGTSRSIPSARFYGVQPSQLSEQIALNGVPPKENSKTKLSTFSSKRADDSGELHLPGRRRQSPGTARSKLTRLRRPADRAAVPQQQKHYSQSRSVSSTTAADSASETKSDAKRPASAVPTRHTAAAAAVQPADTTAGHRATVRATGRDAGLPLRTATSAVAPPHASLSAEAAPMQSAATSATLADKVTAPSQHGQVVNELPSEKKHLEASVVQAQPEAKPCVAGATRGDQLLTAAALHQLDTPASTDGNLASRDEKLPSAAIGATSHGGREQLVARSPGTLAAAAVATPQTAKRPRGRPPRITPAVRVAAPDDKTVLSTPSATSSDDERHSTANSTNMANDRAAEVAGDSVLTEVAGVPGSSTAATTSNAVAGITNGTAGPTPTTGNSECATSESYTVLTSFEAGDSYSTTSKWCIIM